MATITLNYNTRNIRAQQTLDYILSLGYFKTETVKRQRNRPIFNKPVRDAVKTHLASEAVLAKDWLNKNEDEAWKNL